jgi:hypothetical protein
MRALDNHETFEQYLAREGKITQCPSSDVAPRRPIEEAQIRRAPSIHPENRKALKRPQRKKYSAEKEAEVLRLLREGKVQRAVCASVQVSQWVVSQVALAHGLGKRARGGE